MPKHMRYESIGGVLLVLMLLASESLCSQLKQDTLSIVQNRPPQLHSHLYIYPTNEQLSPHAVFDSVPGARFIRLSPKKSYNNTGSLLLHYWLLATIKNTMANDEVYYYCLNAPGLNKATAYAKTDNGPLVELGRSGMMVPFPERQNKSYDTEFRLLIEKGQSITILIDVANPNGTNAFFIPELIDGPTYHVKRSHQDTMIGILTGLMLITLLLNIFYAISLKERIHYLYSLYVFCLLLDIYILEGRINKYISNFALADTIARINPSIISILMALIMQWFLNQTRENSRFKSAVDFSIFLSVLSAVCHLIGYLFNLGASFTNFLQISTCIGLPLQLGSLIASAVEKAIQGKRRAIVYLAATAWLLYGIFQIIFVFLGFGSVEFFKDRPLNIEIGFAIEAIIVFVAIIYRFNLLKRELAKQKEELLKRIVAAEEGERRRIASDLHDQVLPILNTLSLHISNIPAKWQENVDVEAHHIKALTLSNKAAGDLRTVAYNIMPEEFEKSGLFKIMEDRVYELNAVSKINFSLITDGEDTWLSKETAVIIYRIVNELLTNILKHSVASDAAVQILINKKEIEVIAEDDGVGFNSNSRRGIGLNSIHSRVEFLNGKIQVDSSSHGTHIFIQIPIADN